MHHYSQDSYALCRVFKKNVVVCTEIEDQGQCSITVLETPPKIVSVSNDIYETESPADVTVGSSSYADEDDKDDSWMQFISDDAWCSTVSSTNDGIEETSCVV
jgi:hypothetical protein